MILPVISVHRYFFFKLIEMEKKSDSKLTLPFFQYEIGKKWVFFAACFQHRHMLQKITFSFVPIQQLSILYLTWWLGVIWSTHSFLKFWPVFLSLQREQQQLQPLQSVCSTFIPSESKSPYLSRTNKKNIYKIGQKKWPLITKNKCRKPKHNQQTFIS